jgi:hypothetical protein
MAKPVRGRLTGKEKRDIALYQTMIAQANGKDGPVIVPPKAHKIRRPSDNKPIRPTEHQEQCAVIKWWWQVHKMYGLPVFALFAVPNGGARDVITGARLKAEGVRRGVYDLILAKPTSIYGGLFLEMKAGDNKPSEDQVSFGQYLTEAGYKASVHWSAQSAIEEIESYLGQRR